MIPVADLPPIDVAAMAALADQVVDSCKAAQVDIHHLGIERKTLRDGVSFRFTGNLCQNNPRLNLSIVTDTGQVKKLVVQPALTVWVHAPIAATDIERGERVRPRLGLIDIGMISGELVPEGGEARVPIAAGHPITTMNVRVPFDGRMGSDVSLVVLRGPIRLEARGRLLANGRIGDRVKVVNHLTHTVTTGTLIGNSQVLID